MCKESIWQNAHNNKNELSNIKEVELLGALINKSEKDKIDIFMLDYTQVFIY